MNKTWGLWGIGVLSALSLTACGGGTVRPDGDGAVTGRAGSYAYDNSANRTGKGSAAWDATHDNGSTAWDATHDNGSTAWDATRKDNGSAAWDATRKDDGATGFDDAASRWERSAVGDDVSTNP